LPDRIALLGPDLFAAFDDFARALKRAGARVVGVGHTPSGRLRAALRTSVDEWVRVRSPFDGREVADALRGRSPGRLPDRLETLDERLVEPAAAARAELGLPGQSVDSARLCRDKPAMKAALRRAGLPCAESIAGDRLGQLAEFAERVGYPIVVKPRAGLGAQKTFRVDGRAELERAAGELGVGSGGSVAAEEWVEGHEGFYDTLTEGGAPRLDFASHYYPGVLEALADRAVAPQIAATNRIELASYSELRDAGRRALAALGIESGPTHMEWFFGPKGLKISEVGARPPGERIWDLYCKGNDLDLYAAWADLLLGRPLGASPSRRLATGSVQVRPDREGTIDGVDGLAEVRARCGRWIWQLEVPRRGRRTVPPEKGYLANAWFRLAHPDYDELRRMMTFVGRTLRLRARAA